MTLKGHLRSQLGHDALVFLLSGSVVTNTCSQYLNTNTNTTGFQSILNTI